MMFQRYHVLKVLGFLFFFIFVWVGSILDICVTFTCSILLCCRMGMVFIHFCNSILNLT